jgi:putative oxidoreductase
VSRDRRLLVLRVVSGGVFVAFGAGKFVNHASELASFKTYGLPAPEVFVPAIGAIEIIGGVLLMVGLLTRSAAAVLAADMVGAIVVSGIVRGEVISLTLAPAELVAMVVLLWS